jgi:hypothetical protein
VCPSIGTLFIALLGIATFVGLVDECKKLRRESRNLSEPPAVPPAASAG